MLHDNMVLYTRGEGMASSGSFRQKLLLVIITAVITYVTTILLPSLGSPSPVLYYSINPAESFEYQSENLYYSQIIFGNSGNLYVDDWEILVSIPALVGILSSSISPNLFTCNLEKKSLFTEISSKYINPSQAINPNDKITITLISESAPKKESMNIIFKAKGFNATERLIKKGDDQLAISLIMINVWIALIVLVFFSSRYESIKSSFEAIFRKDISILEYVDLASKAGEYRLAYAKLEKAPKFIKKSKNLKLYEIDYGIRSGRLDNPLDEINKIINREEVNAHAYCVRAKYYISEQKYSMAEKDIAKALELDENFQEAHKLNAIILILNDNYVDAIRELAYIKEIDYDIETKYILTQICIKVKEYDIIGDILERMAYVDYYSRSGRGFLASISWGYLSEEEERYDIIKKELRKYDWK